MDTFFVYILSSCLIALLVALFQYRPWQKPRHVWLLTFCRTVSITSLILLIIGPKVTTNTETIIKPSLSILLDNSASIKVLNKDKILDSLADFLQNHVELNQKFEIQSYSFDSRLFLNDSLNFQGKQSNIGSSLQTINAITKGDIAPVILLSDGNQTIGRSFAHNRTAQLQPVYPLIMGDSTAFQDLSIKQVNVNSYTFLDNEFPVEIVLNSMGNTAAETVLEIVSGSKKIYTKQLTFSPSKTSEIATVYLKAKTPGIQRYKVNLKPLDEEILKTNNVKSFGIEVIDQSFKIALISAISHPDLAAIKAIATAQKHYSIVRLNPTEFLENPSDYDVLVLYQPDQSFSTIFDYINQKPINTFTIGGTQTNWSFLNDAQSIFEQEITGQTEDYYAKINPNFETFSVTPLEFLSYPPLTSEFGRTSINVAHDVLLYKTIGGGQTNSPLLLTYNSGVSRHVVFLAEHLWKWRMRDFQRHNSFEKFDLFFGLLLKYLSTQKVSEKLRLSHDVIFDGSAPIEIVAELFNDNFESNTNATLTIEVQSKGQKRPLKFPMLLENTSYRADLSSLKPGRYNFKVQNQTKTISKTGQFDILPFNIESQFLNANTIQLSQLANDTGGKAFFDTQAHDLVDVLLHEDTYVNILKIDKKSLPLVDFNAILLTLIFSLSLEWFMRKYFGLI